VDYPNVESLSVSVYRATPVPLPADCSIAHDPPGLRSPYARVVRAIGWKRLQVRGAGTPGRGRGLFSKEFTADLDFSTPPDRPPRPHRSRQISNEFPRTAYHRWTRASFDPCKPSRCSFRNTSASAPREKETRTVIDGPRAARVVEEIRADRSSRLLLFFFFLLRRRSQDTSTKRFVDLLRRARFAGRLGQGQTGCPRPGDRAGADGRGHPPLGRWRGLPHRLDERDWRGGPHRAPRRRRRQKQPSGPVHRQGMTAFFSSPRRPLVERRVVIAPGASPRNRNRAAADAAAHEAASGLSVRCPSKQGSGGAGARANGGQWSYLLRQSSLTRDPLECQPRRPSQAAADA